MPSDGGAAFLAFLTKKSLKNLRSKKNKNKKVGGRLNSAANKAPVSNRSSARIGARSSAGRVCALNAGDGRGIRTLVGGGKKMIMKKKGSGMGRRIIKRSGKGRIKKRGGQKKRKWSGFPMAARIGLMKYRQKQKAKLGAGRMRRRKRGGGKKKIGGRKHKRRPSKPQKRLGGKRKRIIQRKKRMILGGQKRARGRKAMSKNTITSSEQQLRRAGILPTSKLQMYLSRLI